MLRRPNKAKYEDDLKTIRRVTRLELLVQKLDIDPEQGIRLANARHDADNHALPVVHQVLSAEIPGVFHEGYEDD